MVNRRMIRKERVCSWCSQSFSKDEHLARHVRSHTKEKPFSCSTCGKSFTRHDSLLRHSRSHTEAQKIQPRAYSTTTSHKNNISESAESISVILNHPVSATSESPDSYRSNPGRPPSFCHSPSTHGSHTTHSLPYDYTTLDVGGMPSWTGSDLPQPVESSDQLGLPPTLERLGPSDMDTANSWVISPSHQIPGWLVSDDFDMNALNAQILPPGMSFETIDWSTDGPIAPGRCGHMNNVLIQSSTDIVTEPREDYIQRQWFTYLGPEKSGHITPDVSNEPTSVDERYREDLSRELQQRVNNEPLPSTDFLNLCIQMYFTRFNPIFPIVHEPTFRPSARRSLLLLSICSVGSLFLGSSCASAQGIRIFERLNKAILASWESYIVRGTSDALAMTQAALIGQTFGMLSGNPRHLAIVQTFHGTIIAWARRQNMFDQAPMPIQFTNMAETDIEASWRRWVHSEEKRRVAVGLRIHDTELAELFMMEPFLPGSASRRAAISSDDAWIASTANDWARALTESTNNQNASGSTCESSCTDQSPIINDFECSSFEMYALLEGKFISIMERAHNNPQRETLLDITQSLISIYSEHLRKQTESDPFSLKALWHSAFISLYCDINKLECAVGRDGFDKAQAQNKYATTWASSQNGDRCAIHAALILRHLQRIPIGEEPAIHVPRLLYRASLVWYAYTRFGRDDHSSTISTELEFPELVKAGIDGRRVLFAANGFKKSRPAMSESSTLFHLIDLLTRLGHWGISQKMASLLSILIHGKPHHDISI